MDKAKTKIGVIVILAIIVVLISVFVLAKPQERVAAETKGGAIVIIPAHAVEVAPDIFSLGTATDVDGRVVEGFMFVYKKGNAKPGTVCGNNICEPGEKKSCSADCGGGNGDTTKSTCYSLFAKDAKWKVTEQYITGAGVDAALTQTSLDTWNAEAPGTFGSRIANGTTDGPDDVSPDGKNEVELANLGPTNTIAYTIVWGIFSGPPRGRELTEWDAVFNTAYPFGDADISGNSVMDYQNIAVHEFGHASGLGHPEDTCTEETMYAYADYGETKKRDLNSGDIAGVNKLYG